MTPKATPASRKKSAAPKPRARTRTRGGVQDDDGDYMMSGGLEAAEPAGPAFAGPPEGDMV